MYRPLLETLEDRVVLSPVVVSSPAAYFWRGPGTDYAAATNWLLADGSVPTHPPSSTDDVYFDQLSPGNCWVTTPCVCRSITTFANWNGIFEIDNTNLTVYGTNGQESYTSTWLSGEIQSSVGPGTLNVQGGVFNYRAPSINSFGAAPQRLDVNLTNGVNWGYTGLFSNLGAYMWVGGGSGISTLTLNAPGNITSINNEVITINSKGKLEHYCHFFDARINSFGTVNLYGGSSITTAAQNGTMSILGGVLQIYNFNNNNVIDIHGSLLINNATLVMGGYSDLEAGGNLTFTGTCVVDMSINNADHAQCDSVVAITIDMTASNTTLTTTCNGNPLAGNHQYDLLRASNIFNGSFATYTWQGTRPYQNHWWNWAYVLGIFEESGVI